MTTPTVGVVSNAIAVGSFNSRSSISQTNANITFSYNYNGQQAVALLRVKQLTTTYTLNSEESHARNNRAFYPHRRSQGTFDITFQFKNWKEYSQAMTWFQDYAKLALQTTNTQPSVVMTVTMPSRNFTRSGVPTTGIEFGDHTGSMVFTPTISFISVNDPDDPSTAVLSTSASKAQISLTQEQGIDPLAWAFFYPDSAVNTPGKLPEALFDTGGLATPAEFIQNLLNDSSVAIGADVSQNLYLYQGGVIPR